MKRTALVFALALLLLAAVAISGCVEQQPETVKIGFTGPLSGDLAAWGENEQKGIELAVEEANSAGGISGKKIEVIFEDSQCQPKLAATNLEKLALLGEIHVVIGDTCSSATLAAAPIAESNKIVLITPISGADSISQAGDYIFRNFIPNSYYGVKAAEKVSAMGQTKVAVMYINNDTGVSWKDTFAESFGGEITNIEAYRPDEKDFRTILLKIKENNPEIVLLAGYYQDGAQILKQAKELGLTQQFFGAGDTFDDPVFIEAAGDAAEGFIFQSVPSGSGENFVEFRQAFESRFGKEPSLFTTYAYDTAKIVIEAMKNCGTSSEEIKECLYKTDYQGVTNHIIFDKNGDLVGGETIIKQVKNKEFVLYEGE